MALELKPEALDFVTLLRPNDYIVWGQAAAEPTLLTETLAKQQSGLGPLTAFIGMSFSPTPGAWSNESVSFQSYCGTGENRVLERSGRLDILPIHYSDLPAALSKRIDVLMLSVAPAEPGGRYSFGVAHEYLVPLVRKARLVIAEVNDRVPWTRGEIELGEDDIDVIVRSSRALPEIRRAAVGEVERTIAGRVAGLVEDGATLQAGIGALPNMILEALSQHRDLGLHSGSLLDGVVPLIESGALNNARKTIDTGVSVAGMALGSRRLYDFIHGHRGFLFRSPDYTHNVSVIEKLDRFTSINSAIEVDITGQINTETAGGRYIGAVGGALDFVRGAHRSKGGVSIIALPATAATSNGLTSRIVPSIAGPVSIPRADAGIVVTEYGIADLRGATMHERRRRMIEVAAPQFRAFLERAAREGLPV